MAGCCRLFPADRLLYSSQAFILEVEVSQVLPLQGVLFIEVFGTFQPQVESLLSIDKSPFRAFECPFKAFERRFYCSLTIFFQ